jgi:multiple sugar transport system substrate-binding protein
MRRTRTVGTSALVLAVALVAPACGGGDGAGGGGGGERKTLTVWTIEDVADRVQATKRLTQQFTSKTGVKVNLVAVAEDQFDQLITSAAAAKKLPDVVAALSLAGVRSLDASQLLSTDIAGGVVRDLGQDSFVKRALELTRAGDRQLSVPSDGWAQLLVYRKDVFDKGGLAPPTSYDAIEKAASTLDKSGMAGITLATVPGDTFTQQSFEYFALANGCQLVDADKHVMLNSPACVAAFDFYAKLARQYSVSGNQDVDSTRATYFAGRAAMLVWSSFILDEMAGLRDDALPTCPECRKDKAFLAKNSGIVAALQGPNGSPAQYGEIVSWAATKDAPKDATAQFIKFMMSDAYVDWLALAPEGKVPVRQGPQAGDTSYLTAWQKLEAGVDTKAPLSNFYSSDVLSTVQRSPETFSRWGLVQGQGELVGATLGELPVPKALSDLIAGKGDARSAADAAQKAVEEIQDNLN